MTGADRRIGGLSRRCLLAGAAAVLTARLAAPSPTRAAAPVVPSRGINIPGWFDRIDGVGPTEAVLEELRSRGFSSIRLPVDGEVALSGALGTIRRAVEGLVSAGFSVLVDLHPSAGLHAALRSDPAAGGQRVAEAWTTLGPVIADLPEKSVYPELLNEPPMTTAAWLPLRERLADIVRAACPEHTLVWGPAPDQGIWQLDATPPLSEGRQIAAVHFYAPMAFTHQCQSWGDTPLARISGLPFPANREMPAVVEKIGALRTAGDGEAADLVEEQLATDWTVAAIEAQIAPAATWSAATGCPVMLNEFGVLDFCVDAASRTAWVRAVRRAAEASGIGWAYWELDQGFGLIRDRSSTEGFDEAMLDALFGAGG